MSRKQGKKPGVLDVKEAFKVLKDGHPVECDGQIFMCDWIDVYDGQRIACVIGFCEGVPASIRSEDLWVSFFENEEFKKIPITLELAQYTLFKRGMVLVDEFGFEYTRCDCISRALHNTRVVVKFEPGGRRPIILCDEEDFPHVFPTLGPLTMVYYRH